MPAHSRKVRPAQEATFTALDLLVLGLIGRGHHARFVSTARASYLVTNAPEARVQWLAARMGAVLGGATRLGFSVAYPVTLAEGAS